MKQPLKLGAAAAVLALGAGAQAANVSVTVTAQNLSPTNSLTFAPLHVGFHSGVYDAFDLGGVASAAIQSVAEGGAGASWFPAFAAADPGATLGTVLPAPLLPGASASTSFVVDSTQNRFFTFASMAVPSNDFFIGNDAPTAHALFDGGGNQQIGSITVSARQIWDAGTEIHDPAAAAFVGDNDLRADQNSVVAFNFAEFAAFNGMTTAAGYTFDSQLAADTEVYRISFAVNPVPEPGSYAMLMAGLIGVGAVVRRRRRRA